MGVCLFYMNGMYVSAPCASLPVEAQTGHCPLKETKIGKNFQSPLFNLCSVIAQEHSERTALAQMLQHTSPGGLPSVVTANSFLEDTWAVLYILEINSKKKRQSELAESALASENLNPKTSGIQLFLKLRMSSSISYCHFKSVMWEW